MTENIFSVWLTFVPPEIECKEDFLGQGTSSTAITYIAGLFFFAK